MTESVINLNLETHLEEVLLYSFTLIQDIKKVHLTDCPIYHKQINFYHSNNTLKLNKFKIKFKKIKHFIVLCLIQKIHSLMKNLSTTTMKLLFQLL